MGKKAPKAPDPYKTAAAQGGMNMDTAITQQFLNSGTQVNPWGTVNTEVTGNNTFVDSQGKTITVPKFTQTTTLSPEQQAIFNQSQAAEGNLAGIANDQSAFLKDYLNKPFDPQELVARVRAVLRRAAAAVPAPAASTLRFGDIVLDDVSRTVRVGGVPVELTFKEYALLHLFLEHPEEVLARERIMKDVWDTDDLLESRTIDMHVRTLRQKLGAAGEAIRTVRKVGYKLSTEGSDD